MSDVTGGVPELRGAIRVYFEDAERRINRLHGDVLRLRAETHEGFTEVKADLAAVKADVAEIRASLRQLLERDAT